MVTAQSTISDKQYTKVREKISHYAITNLIIATILASIFFLYCFYIISIGHFHEDAYILFKYVNNIVAGCGISYDASCQAAEGVIDFLWLMLLSAMAFFKIDVGIAAIIANSLGVLLICYILIQTVWCKRNDYQHFYFLIPCLLILLFSEITHAAAAGFSTYLYCALNLLCLHLVYRGSPQTLIWIPYVSIILGLFRADGVILGVGYSLVGLYLATRLDITRLYSKHLIIPFFVGITYFIWRYHYFGLLLPLPLYVKSGSADKLTGLFLNRFWFKLNINLISCFAFSFLFINKRKNALFGLLPALALLASLCVATQSQNVGFRFQAPVYISLFYLTILGLRDFLSKFQKHWLSAAVCVLLIYQSYSPYKNFQKFTDYLIQHNYINVFPSKLAKLLPKGSKLAITEAGRLAYWYDGKITDLVGLNTPYPAINNIDENYISSLSPDFLMYHHAATLENFDAKAQIRDIDQDFIWENMKDIFKAKDKSFDKVKTAAVAANRYLKLHGKQYDVISVKYYGHHSHIYAIKKSLGITNDIKRILHDSFKTDGDISYLSLRRK